MLKTGAALIGLLISSIIGPVVGADPPACPSTTNSQYDYIVVGAGAGGGPLAARLALNGYKVLLLEAGPDSYQNNVTIPFYFGRTTEDEKLALDYEVDHYTSPNNVTAWYPRSQGIGGSTIHNALIHMRAQNWDFDNIADITGDSSWRSSSMQKYLTRLEKNLYVPEQAGGSLGYGYDGWLSTNSAPFNLVNGDEQIGSIMNTLMSSVPAIGGSDWNNLTADGVAGSATLTFTRDQYGNRSSTRDHLVDVRTRFPDKLTIQTETMATRILICKSSDGSLQAYGVEAASGSYLLPVARQFAGKRTLNLKTYTARYEIISSAGTFQTPQLLMLSGIGPSQQLSNLGISTFVDLPGDKLDINKNYLGSAESIEDLTILRDNIQKSRRYVASTPQINRWIVQETWPGSQYQTDEQLWEFLRANVFGHHLCCSAKIGADNDSMAVLNSQFQLRGVKNLRVVDASVFPDIPGMFITTPIYTISEKAADLVLDTAKANGWGTGAAAVTGNSNSGTSIKVSVDIDVMEEWGCFDTGSDAL
ncbi:unnamed protein product [Rhizoctonia solani]|uniref:Glucose-methanol-choline oxidoreductase N-terminal domain-containing protein n=1 Tax=Rhizoctonia solani TaxID=456999 RepID=A0A8H2ZWQ3_9AGAM|nr:unnamed protein product [Rhizoctonia solani]